MQCRYSCPMHVLLIYLQITHKEAKNPLKSRERIPPIAPCHACLKQQSFSSTTQKASRMMNLTWSGHVGQLLGYWPGGVRPSRGWGVQPGGGKSGPEGGWLEEGGPAQSGGDPAWRGRSPTTITRMTTFHITPSFLSRARRKGGWRSSLSESWCHALPVVIMGKMQMRRK